MSKRITAILIIILFVFYPLKHLIVISADSLDSGYLLRGFSYGFYKIFNNDKTTCTSITSRGEETVIFRKSGYKISKAVTSKSYLYILAESEEYHAIFTLLRNGNTDASYIPNDDVTASSFTASDNYIYFISNDKSYIVSVKRTTLEYSMNFFTESINKLFCYNEKVYAVTESSIYCLDNPSVPIKCDIPSFDSLEPVFYDNIFIDSNSKVYSFSPDSGFEYIYTLSYEKAFVLNHIYYGVSGNTIYQLSKDGSSVGKYTFTENIDDIAVSGNKIALLYSKNVKLISAKDFLPLEAETSKNESSTNTNSLTPDSDFKGFTDYTTDGSYIIVPQGTTAAVLKRHINSAKNSSFIFYNDDGKRIDTGTLGTGFVLDYYENSNLKSSYTIIVMGDVTGEGSINTRDKRRLKDYLLGKLDLTAPQKYAADLDKNNIIDSLDLLLLTRSK